MQARHIATNLITVRFISGYTQIVPPILVYVCSQYCISISADTTKALISKV